MPRKLQLAPDVVDQSPQKRGRPAKAASTRTFKDLYAVYLRLQQKLDVLQRVIESLEPYIEHDIGATKKMESITGMAASIDPDIIFEVQQDLRKIRKALEEEVRSTDSRKIG